MDLIKVLCVFEVDATKVLILLKLQWDEYLIFVLVDTA
jgi:hypothetical protein